MARATKWYKRNATPLYLPERILVQPIRTEERGLELFLLTDSGVGKQSKMRISLSAREAARLARTLASMVPADNAQIADSAQTP